jgi:hypothetical protein
MEDISKMDIVADEKLRNRYALLFEKQDASN